MSIVIKNGVVRISNKGSHDITVDTTTMSKHDRGQYGKALFNWNKGGQKGFPPAPKR